MQQEHDFAQAERQYRELLVSEPTLSEARMGLARALGGQGKDAEAEVVYREALELQPTSSILRVNLANVMAAQGRHEDGLAEMLSVLEQVPGDSTAQIGALRMLTDLNRNDEALAKAQKWLEEKPEDSALQAHLGVLLARKGDIDTAFTLLKESLKDDVPRQLVHRTLAIIQLQRNHPRLALHNYRKEIQYFPSDPTMHLKCARILMSLKDWAEAIKEFEAYNKRKPDDVTIRQPWAQSVFNTQNYTGAAEVLEPALVALPDNPDVLLLHANILGKLGKRDEAKAALARANEMNNKRVEEQRKNQTPGGSKAPTPQPPAPPQ